MSWVSNAIVGCWSWAASGSPGGGRALLARGRASSWRRRPLALAVVGLYVLVGLLDSIAWVGGAAPDDADAGRATAAHA